MITAYVTSMRRYASFQGRAPRSELWWFKLVMVVLCLAALRIDGFIFGGSDDEQVPFLCLAFLAHVLPSIAVDVRRLHDTDRSGWFALFGMIPLVGPVILLVWFCQSGSPGANRFGPDPLADVARPRVGSLRSSGRVGVGQPNRDGGVLDRVEEPAQ